MSGLPGNPFVGDGHGLLAFEQRTASLIALLALGRAPKGVVWEEWENAVMGEIANHLGLERVGEQLGSRSD